MFYANRPCYTTYGALNSIFMTRMHVIHTHICIKIAFTFNECKFLSRYLGMFERMRLINSNILVRYSYALSKYSEYEISCLLPYTLITRAGLFFFLYRSNGAFCRIFDEILSRKFNIFHMFA